MPAHPFPDSVTAPPRSALVDLLLSLRFGLRDAIRPAVLLISLLTALLAFGFCSLLFVVFWSSISDFTHAVAAAAVALPLSWFGVAAPEASGVLAALTAVLSGMLLLGSWLLSILLAYRLALEFVLMARISALVRHDYPQLQPCSSDVVSRLYLLLSPLLTFVLLAPLLLLLPLVGGPLLFALSGYLLVRSLMGDALEGVATGNEVRQLLRCNRLGMLLLGVLLSALILIPPLGLLAPGLIGSCVCHFAFRRLLALRQAL